MWPPAGLLSGSPAAALAAQRLVGEDGAGVCEELFSKDGRERHTVWGTSEVQYLGVGPAFSRAHPRVICDLHNELGAPRAGSGGARGNLPLAHTSPFAFTRRAWQGCRAEHVRESLQFVAKGTA